MLDTVIVGGGLCGLSLARGLQQQGRTFALFDARDRWGGRVLTVPSECGTALDMGPTWFWPETQPRITQLVSELGLHSFAQHDSGTVLQHTDPNRQPETLQVGQVHSGSRRVAGGMTSLIQALVAQLPADALHLGHELRSVRERGDHVELQFGHGSVTSVVRARCVVLALPPRLLAERVRFEPALSESLLEAMTDTPTWMADRAKALVAYSTAFWRADGHSGNAFVQHPQAVLAEIFDACDEAGDHAALGGFSALPPAYRAQVRALSMNMLVSSQLSQVFGIQAEDGEQHLQDWAQEPYTCSELDRTPLAAHPDYGNPRLREPQWAGKLHLGGSETASYGGGYLEGALEAAARIQRSLAALGALQSKKEGAAMPAAANDPVNTNSVQNFGSWVAGQRASAFERYRRHLNQNLAGQVKEQLTQRALLGVVEQVYSEALTQLDQLPFNGAQITVQQGRSELTPVVLAPFSGFSKALLDEAITFNRGSCAISNFPQDHEPDRDYVDTIARDLAAAWREFALNANAVMLAKR